MRRGTIALAALLVIQTGALLVRARGHDAAPAAAEKAPLFPGLTLDQVARVRIADRGGQAVELARKGEGWVVASAGDYPAKKDAVERFLSKLVGLESTGVAATSEASHAAFEVAEALFQRDVRLFDGAGGEKARLFLGRQGAGGAFVRRAGAATVHRTAESLVWQAAVQPLPFIDTQLVKLDAKKAKGLTISRGKAPVAVLEKDEGGAWRASGPEAFDADKAKVEEVLRGLARAYAAAPAAAAATPAHGLEGEAALTVEATLEGGEKAGLTIGAPGAAGRRFARPLGAEAVAEVSDAAAKALEKDLSFFRPAPPAAAPAPTGAAPGAGSAPAPAPPGK
jgi:hypothetical protein